VLATTLLAVTLSGVFTPGVAEAAAGGTLSEQLRSLRSELQQVRENIKKLEVARQVALVTSLPWTGT